MIFRIKDMVWKEIRSAAENGAVAVIPLGSTEQHGPHLPAKTDALLVERVVSAALERFQANADSAKAVVTPTLTIGASDHHKPFFAFSVSEETYISMVADACTSLAEAGFGKLFVVNGHGGNSAPIRVAVSRLKYSAPDTLVVVGEYWALAAGEIRSLRITEPGGAAHAGEIETSLMMHLSPNDVRTDEVERSVPSLPKGFEIDLIDGGAASLYAPWNRMSEHGQVGDPTASSAELGRRFFDAATNAVVRALKEFVKLQI